jgi:hypothetical protein
MGTGDKEMGTPTAPKSKKDTGKPSRKDKRFEELWGHLSCELGELSVVTRSTTEAIQQSDYRRVESLQRSVDEAFQSAEKALKELRETYYSDGHTNPSRDE